MVKEMFQKYQGLLPAILKEVTHKTSPGNVWLSGGDAESRQGVMSAIHKTACSHEAQLPSEAARGISFVWAEAGECATSNEFYEELCIGLKIRHGVPAATGGSALILAQKLAECIADKAYEANEQSTARHGVKTCADLTSKETFMELQSRVFFELNYYDVYLVHDFGVFIKRLINNKPAEAVALLGAMNKLSECCLAGGHKALGWVLDSEWRLDELLKGKSAFCPAGVNFNFIGMRVVLAPEGGKK
jgi:hypothetical protein